MSNKTLREMIEDGELPSDRHGFTMVPTNGSGMFSMAVNGEVTKIGVARVICTDAPGPFPIVAIGPCGDAVQYDEDGGMKPTRDVGKQNYDGEEIWWNSLAVPRPVDVRGFAHVGPDGNVSWFGDEPFRDGLCDNEQVVTLTGQRMAYPAKLQTALDEAVEEDERAEQNECDCFTTDEDEVAAAYDADPTPTSFMFGNLQSDAAPAAPVEAPSYLRQPPLFIGARHTI